MIAIDGPSAAGKGTVAHALARKLRWHFLDSGALYRILALAALQRGIPLQQGSQVAALVPDLDIRFDPGDDDRDRIWVNGQDLTTAVRAETAGRQASQIAADPAVRAALLQRQRAFRQAPGLVADGRDMGTVVFPDACLKVFLDASPEERARRRHRQLRMAGIEAKMPALCEEIRERDVRDRNRPHSPLVAAPDAVVLDTTGFPADTVLSRIEALLTGPTDRLPRKAASGETDRKDSV
ncbi:MAG: (d)CMP kinase [Nevskiales bacterium]|nr:(d)CMP kinase [Nevskiales bacterium]